MENTKAENAEPQEVMAPAEVLCRCGQAMERTGDVKPVQVFMMEAALEKCDRILSEPSPAI